MRKERIGTNIIVMTSHDETSAGNPSGVTGDTAAAGEKVSEDIGFEESLEKLNYLADKIKEPGTNLEDSLAYYEEAMKYYEICNKILKTAEQKIETIEEVRP